MANYWRWMHARLDALLDEADVDAEESAGMLPRMPLPRLADHGGMPFDSVRGVGVGGNAGFDARPFEGLREGIVRLG